MVLQLNSVFGPPTAAGANCGAEVEDFNTMAKVKITLITRKHLIWLKSLLNIRFFFLL